MKIPFLLFCFLTATGFVETQSNVFTVHAGEDFRNVFKSFTKVRAVIVTYLCRMPCEQSRNLMEVHGRRTKSGRYVLRLENVLDVHLAITRVVKEDAGHYKLGVRSVDSEEHVLFQLNVKDLCGGGVSMDVNHEYWVTEGSSLSVTCNLALHPRNRKFLCRGECSSYLIDTNDEKGYSSKYSVEYLDYNSFKVMIYNMSAQDSGRYCCGMGRETSPNFCKEFTVRVRGAHQSDPNVTERGPQTAVPDFTESNHQPDFSPTVPNSTEDDHELTLCTEGTGLALPIVTSVLVCIILILVSLLIHKWKKPQSPHYVNCSTNMSTSPAERQSQLASSGNSDPIYSSLSPENRDSDYYPLRRQGVPEYLPVI